MSLNLAGQTLGKYHILEEIGRGGMGVVYKAHDTVLDRLVAIKVLAPHLTWDQEFVKRFLHEARSAARLEHAHVVTIYDVAQAQGHHVIAMKYLEGRSLAEIIRREGPLPPERAAHLLAQIAQALDYAHARKLIHRDVKPGNVIVSPQDHATLTDFGIARSLEGTRLTQSGVMVGTPAYMSPEQVQGHTVGPATDVYALGIVAYEMLGGRPPFEGETPRLLHAHVYEEPRPLSQVSPKVAPAVGAVVKKALAKEPGKRYGSAGAFAAALGQAIGSREPRVVPKPVPRSGQAPLWPLFGALAAVLLVVALLLGLRELVTKPDQAAATQTATVAATGTAIAQAAVPTPGTPTPQPPMPTPVPPSPTPVPPTSTSIIIVVTATPVPVTDTPIPPTTAPTPTSIIIVVTATPVPPTPTSIIIVVTATPVPATSTPIPPTTTPTPTPAFSGMVRIPAGGFIQGSTVDEVNHAHDLCTSYDEFDQCWRSALDDELPQHEVYLDEFYIDEREVTNAQYGQCVKTGLCDPPLALSSNTRSSYFDNPRYADYPVIYVTWYDAANYCRWAGKRLPTEAKWEKAARGASGMLWPWGNSFSLDMGNIRPGEVAPDTVDTTQVGSYPRGVSPYGAMDMAGNVWEWVADWYDDSYYQLSPSGNPQGPASGEKKVFRGGSWNSNIGGARAASRAGTPPDGRYFDIGFRCAQ